MVSGNLGEGVEISHGSGTLHNQIIGNLIGTNLTGTAAPMYARNIQSGVRLEGAAQCASVCAPDSGFNVVKHNVIVNNVYGGVMIDKGVHDSVVSDNLIGVLPNGTPAPNMIWGVRIEKGSFKNTIGPDNEISYNPNGIQLTADGSSPGSPIAVATYRNTFTRNRIHDTAGLGIDLAPLGSVTNTPSSLVNNGIQLPTITSAQPTTVTVSTCANCTVELFVADRPALQFGPGKTYVASAVANASGVATLPVSAAQAGLPVTVTTTSALGDTSEFSRNVTVPGTSPTNVPPNAVLNASCVLLTCTMNASGSTDPDGTILWYTYDFGDGTRTTTAATSLTHTYATGGPRTATLTVTDNQGATSTDTQQLQPNMPLTAAFTFACTGLSCTFDASQSTGAIATYGWNWGDGTANGAGSTQTHVYAIAGTYPVTLTVRDNQGAVATTVQSVTVTNPVGATKLAEDQFTRTLASGWGAANPGGNWTVSTASAFSVNGAQGSISSGAGAGNNAYLRGVTSNSTDLTFTIGVNKVPTGSGLYVSAIGRSIVGAGDYRAVARLLSDGRVTVRLGRARADRCRGHDRP